MAPKDDAIAYLEANRDSYSKEELIEQLKSAGYATQSINAAVKHVYGDLTTQAQPGVEAPSAPVVRSSFIVRWAAWLLDLTVIYFGTSFVAFVIVLVLSLAGIPAEPSQRDIENIVASEFEEQIYMEEYNLTRSEVAEFVAVARSEQLVMGASYGISFILVAILYNVIMLYKYQATVGKLMARIVVVREGSFERLSLGRIILRHTVGRFLSTIIFFVGYLLALFSDKNRTLHDMISGSAVVNKESLDSPHSANHTSQ